MDGLADDLYDASLSVSEGGFGVFGVINVMNVVLNGDVFEFIKVELMFVELLWDDEEFDVDEKLKSSEVIYLLLLW